MPTVQRSHYVLAVPDLDRAARWFEEVLGCVRQDVDPGNWTFMYHGRVVFQLGRCPGAIPPANLGDHAYFAMLVVDDVDAFHARAAEAMGRPDGPGGRVRKPPTDEPWGQRECALETVDGHRLMLATQTAGGGPAWPRPEDGV